ncbi:hypothetical protein F4V57_06690 [Acinetobacter qingfengensis]|uniref:Uncharacterized protein n=1 Tax=Acinetobacter qingfengensis TaxID=1262585 RepID=A0A1E7R3V1_9GAMM|nr:hypothetical protein [Acinetobacter qingfengensis]KAA8733737.1 hypothetical protein F4V57_06690 [Acinetobacter qingfengensis]OEY94039.1 hypothetical protein BJI46_13625 [Acinetobacter qingfengensis]
MINIKKIQIGYVNSLTLIASDAITLNTEQATCLVNEVTRAIDDVIILKNSHQTLHYCHLHKQAMPKPSFNPSVQGNKR